MSGRTPAQIAQSEHANALCDAVDRAKGGVDYAVPRRSERPGEGTVGRTVNQSRAPAGTSESCNGSGGTSDHPNGGRPRGATGDG
jgi:hypothetical protein